MGVVGIRGAGSWSPEGPHTSHTGEYTSRTTPLSVKSLRTRPPLRNVCSRGKQGWLWFSLKTAPCHPQTLPNRPAPESLAPSAGPSARPLGFPAP